MESAVPSTAHYNTRNPAIKRIMSEWKELRRNQSAHLTAAPLEDNLFEWHFSIRGPPDSPFAGGVYHGRILLPHDYPMKPPNIVFLTPNGRFDVGMKICLTVSAHHPETWRPSWSIRTVLTAIIGFMPSSGNGAIGSLDYSDEVRHKLARESLAWRCEVCGSANATALPQPEEGRGVNAQATEELSSSVNAVLDDQQRFPPAEIQIDKIEPLGAREARKAEGNETAGSEDVGEAGKHDDEETGASQIGAPARAQPPPLRGEERVAAVRAGVGESGNMLASVLDISIAVVFFSILLLLLRKFALHDAR